MNQNGNLSSQGACQPDGNLGGSNLPCNVRPRMLPRSAAPFGWYPARAFSNPQWCDPAPRRKYHLNGSVICFLGPSLALAATTAQGSHRGWRDGVRLQFRGALGVANFRSQFTICLISECNCRYKTSLSPLKNCFLGLLSCSANF